jgi:hypothetical protein
MDVRPLRSVVRIRPSTKSESASPEAAGVRWDEAQGSVSVDVGNNAEAQMAFDAVIAPTSLCGTSQAAFYNAFVQPVIGAALTTSNNATVLAYGQTGSGKTYTIGSDPHGASMTSSGVPPTSTHGLIREIDGIVPRAVAEVFATCASNAVVRVSYAELYNEQFRDLLRSEGRDHRARVPPLRLRLKPSEDAFDTSRFYVENLSSFQCDTCEEALDWYRLGSQRRSVRGHALNARSSRAHTIFTISVMRTATAETDDVRHSSEITLVDLAGSEKLDSILAASPSSPTTPRAATPRPSWSDAVSLVNETTHINASLLTLGKVIDALVANSSAASAGARLRTSGGGSGAGLVHVPYRDSKLTCLLRHVIGHRSATVLIACVNPAFPAESLRTLHFASRARRITASSTLAAVPAAPGARLVQELRLRVVQLEAEVLCLTEQLRTQGSLSPCSVPTVAPPWGKPPPAPAPRPRTPSAPSAEGDDAEFKRRLDETVAEAKRNADAIIEPLAAGLTSSCERLQSMVDVNRQMRSALDATTLRAKRLGAMNITIEQENAALRDRVAVLEAALMAQSRQEHLQTARRAPHHGPAPPARPHRAAPTKPQQSNSVFVDKGHKAPATTGSAPASTAPPTVAARPSPYGADMRLAFQIGALRRTIDCPSAHVNGSTSLATLLSPRRPDSA